MDSMVDENFYALAVCCCGERYKALAAYNNLEMTIRPGNFITRLLYKDIDCLINSVFLCTLYKLCFDNFYSTKMMMTMTGFKAASFTP